MPLLKSLSEKTLNTTLSTAEQHTRLNSHASWQPNEIEPLRSRFVRVRSTICLRSLRHATLGCDSALIRDHDLSQRESINPRHWKSCTRGVTWITASANSTCSALPREYDTNTGSPRVQDFSETKWNPQGWTVQLSSAVIYSSPFSVGPDGYAICLCRWSGSLALGGSVRGSGLVWFPVFLENI